MGGFRGQGLVNVLPPKTPIMPKGKTIVEYDEDITKQIDGLYSDHEYVYCRV